MDANLNFNVSQINESHVHIEGGDFHAVEESIKRMTVRLLLGGALPQ